MSNRDARFLAPAKGSETTDLVNFGRIERWENVRIPHAAVRSRRRLRYLFRDRFGELGMAQRDAGISGRRENNHAGGDEDGVDRAETDARDIGMETVQDADEDAGKGDR